MFLLLLKQYKAIPFGLAQFVSATKGKRLDIGCISDATLKIPQQLGWNVLGIEIDKLAADVSLRLKELKMHYLVRLRTNRTGEDA